MKNATQIKPKILLVDDEPNILASYSRGLRRNWELVTAGSGEDGLREIHDNGPFAVIVADFNMPHMDGITFLTYALAMAPESVRMMLTGEGDFHIATKAVNEGNIFRFMTKPCSLENLEKALFAGHKQYQLLQIEKAARQQEIDIAGEIQQTLLFEPVPYGLNGADVAAVSIPSQGVDGDFIDFFTFSSTKFDVIVGDVMGKGVHAALVGAGTRNRLSRTMWSLSRCSKEDPSPEVIMQALDDAVQEQLGQLCKFITMVYARFDLLERSLKYVDAGHMPILWYSAAKEEWASLKGRNFPLGIPMIRAAEQFKISFSKNDLFLFYSDGLSEGRNQQGWQYGDKQFMHTISKLPKNSAKKFLELLIEDFKSFAARDQFDDDLTIVVVRITD
ncbi:MAG: SpoIIE family protein phosphatase [Candidatus Riflebacteria bacterium]|nr:SpoIIE family protein phosphatase [Candidatus Riflebacteria bacterium]